MSIGVPAVIGKDGIHASLNFNAENIKTVIDAFVGSDRKAAIVAIHNTNSLRKECRIYAHHWNQKKIFR